MVSAQQLADISWSAVFDDVELNAEEIERLASEARPLVESKGQWIELDKADLSEAAAALAEYSKKTQMSGAEMLRHALGLEGRALGGITLDGDGWAADLLRSVKELPENPVTKPEGLWENFARTKPMHLRGLIFLITLVWEDVLRLIWA